MKIPMIAQKARRHGGKRLQVGDAFEATGKTQARLLTRLGWATPGEPPPPPAPAPAPAPARAERVPHSGYQSRALKAEAPAEAPAEAKAPEAEKVADADEAAVKPARAYKRRDMSAEDS